MACLLKHDSTHVESYDIRISFSLFLFFTCFTVGVLVARRCKPFSNNRQSLNELLPNWRYYQRTTVLQSATFRCHIPESSILCVRFSSSITANPTFTPMLSWWRWLLEPVASADNRTDNLLSRCYDWNVPQTWRTECSRFVRIHANIKKEKKTTTVF